ncbi:hypothetical protein [Kitasatospora sp. NPDC017646]|uniref:hypothetical protein n=1 Tax=Kitasatospora sp. NPDC017646 TaxID=3364024 RepID=UPI0037B526C4
MSPLRRRPPAAPPHVYRITKYDPADRDERDVYTGTQEAVSDHGPVEAAYLEAVAALPDDGLVELVREGHDGRITGEVDDPQEFRARAAELSGARAAAVLSVYTDERTPLFTAVLPDADGVLRARWRTEPTPADL